MDFQGLTEKLRTQIQGTRGLNKFRCLRINVEMLERIFI